MRRFNARMASYNAADTLWREIGAVLVPSNSPPLKK